MASARALSGAGTLLFFACNTIVGIEEAKLDPDVGAGSGGGGDAGSSGGGAGGSGGASPLCRDYCEAVQANCLEDDALAVYTSEAVCLAVCEHLPPGDPDDRAVNTTECRLFNAEAAGDFEPDVHCPISGPSGGDTCGTPCQAYCTLFEAICPDDFRDDCLDTCKDVPDLGGYDISITSGDSIQCRTYHVSAAAVAPNTHCVHAAGREICVPDGGASHGDHAQDRPLENRPVLGSHPASGP